MFGRCARQGDPGSCEAIVALDDEIFRTFAAPLVALVRAAGWARAGHGASSWPLAALRWLAQSRAEQHDSRIRRDTLKMDMQLEKNLAFSGKHE